MYLGKNASEGHFRAFKYKVGDLVRITAQKHPFTRVFFTQSTHEIFTVNQRLRTHDGFPLYSVKSCTGEELEDHLYENELVRYNKDLENEYHYIKDVINEEYRDGVKYVEVTFQHFPRKCTAWVPEKELKTYKSVIVWETGSFTTCSHVREQLLWGKKSNKLNGGESH